MQRACGWSGHVEPIEEGGVNDRWHFLPGRSKQSNIVLKYGLLDAHSAKFNQSLGLVSGRALLW